METNMDKRFACKVYVKSKDLYEWEELKKTKMVAEGYWRGRHWVIGKNRFCEPVVYVQYLGKENPGEDYFGKAYWLDDDQIDDKMYCGWDHGHADDYSPDYDRRYGFSEGHKWCIAEIMMEISEWIGVQELYDEEEHARWIREGW